MSGAGAGAGGDGGWYKVVSGEPYDEKLYDKTTYTLENLYDIVDAYFRGDVVVKQRERVVVYTDARRTTERFDFSLEEPYVQVHEPQFVISQITSKRVMDSWRGVTTRLFKGEPGRRDGGAHACD